MKSSKDLLYLHCQKLVHHHSGERRRLYLRLLTKIWLLWAFTVDFNECILNKPKGKCWLNITWPWWEFTQPSQFSLQNSSYIIRRLCERLEEKKMDKHIDFKPCPGHGLDHKKKGLLETRPNVLLLELRVLCVASLGQEPLGKFL